MGVEHGEASAEDRGVGRALREDDNFLIDHEVFGKLIHGQRTQIVFLRLVTFLHEPGEIQNHFTVCLANI